MLQSPNFKLLPRPNPSTPTPNTNHYTLKYLARGSFGKVYQAIHKQTHQVFALKQISKLNDKNQFKSARELEYINQQLKIMYGLDSPYIVKLYDHFQSEVSIYLVLELVEGVQLYSGVIQRKLQLQSRIAARIIQQLCLALKHMHQRSILHRDIKPQNILLTKNLNIKLIDFGTANYFGPEYTRNTKIGSLPYFAPEIVQKQKQDDAVDVWCVGILMYELYAFRTPFQHEKFTEVNILRNKIEFTGNMEPELRGLIGRVLVKEPAGRLSIEEILRHPWITKHHTKPSEPRKNALLSNDQKSKDWSTSGKPLTTKPRPISNKSSTSSIKSLGKRFSPTKLLQSKLKQLEKQHSQLTLKQTKQSAREKQQLERKLKDTQARLEKTIKDTVKKQQMIVINQQKMEKLKREIEQAKEFKRMGEELRGKIKGLDGELREGNQEGKTMKLKELAMGMEVKQLKRQMGQQGMTSMSMTPRHHNNSYSARSKVPSFELKARLQTEPTEAFRTEDTVQEIDNYISSLKSQRNRPPSEPTI